MPIVDPFDRPKKPSPLAQDRQLRNRATEESINSSRLNQAKDAADLAKAPIDRARAGVQLQIDQATKDAQIRKEIANANDAEYAAKIKQLQAQYPSLTAEQTLAGARAALMSEGDKAYKSAKGFDPASPKNLLAGALSLVPWAGQTMATAIRDPESQMAVAGRQQFTEGAARSLTGAGMRGDERPYTQSDFYPTPFESPAVKRQKETLRQKYLNQIIQAAGPAYKGDTAVSPAPATTKSGAPKAGDVMDGYRFRGGNPADKTNWDKVQ